MTDFRIDNVVSLYGAVPVAQRADTLHSMQATINAEEDLEVTDTLTAIAAWQVARKVAAQA